jgi:hypothetical protein
MAGDWLKIEAVTPDKPEVFEIATLCSITPDDAFGKLFRVWRWFDQQTENGNARNVTWAYLDHVVGVSGFAKAMHSVGWLNGGEHGNAGVTLPNFDRHNGKTAKSRALTAKRVATHKERRANDEVTQAPLPREEKRRSKTPVVPLNFPEGVTEADWQAFRDHRSANRKKLTPRAEELALAKLHHLAAKGYDAKKLLEHAIESGWATFYEREECRTEACRRESRARAVPPAR